MYWGWGGAKLQGAQQRGLCPISQRLYNQYATRFGMDAGLPWMDAGLPWVVRYLLDARVTSIRRLPAGLCF